ncbi:MAG: CBS domain-containing protein [Methanobrevibacter sp.]
MSKLGNLKVKDLMTKEVVTTDPDQEVVFAFEKLMKEKISSMPVIDNNKMVGIVTATDLGHNLILDNYTLGTKVVDVMVKQVAFVNPENSIVDAINEMNNNSPGKSIINQLPVLDHGKLVGILSDGDIIHALKDEF